MFGREQKSVVALLLTFTLTVPIVTWNISHTANYHTTVSPSVISLVGGVDEGLASQISFDSAKNQYVFNANGKKAQSPAPTDTYSLTVGADKSNPASTYSVDLPVDPKQGFTYYNNHLQLSFTLIPQFPMGPGQETGGRIVYPLENGGEAIYTVKGNGLREDLIFTQPTTTANFTYQLKLPDTLQAQSKDGVIGIYSADPSLFGNISFGSDTDKTKVMDARSKSAKTNLVFAVAPPVVQDMHGSSATTNYSLSGDHLQVSANHLSTLAYPITLDPSIVVNSTAGFATGNNEDGNIDFPANKINRGGLTGGVLGAWTATTALPATRYIATSVAYNGYLYDIGGALTSVISAVVDYAQINADGTLGAWAATTPLLVATDYATSVAYNGYLYEIGGSNSVPTKLTTVDYAPINADGTLGAWTATTSLPAATDDATSVAYNGYLYEIGGLAPAATAVVDYAPIHADGTVGAWTATTALPATRYIATSVAYNGYLYEIGGALTSVTSAVVDYAQINADGTLGAWAATTSLLVATDYLTSVVYNGYLYEIGGSNSVPTKLTTVDYAPINSNGTLGAWTATTSLPAATDDATSVAYNGYLYELGGLAPAATAVVDYAKIQPAGWIGSGNPTAWGTTTVLPTATDYEASVAYNGYLYSLGGQRTTGTTNVTDYAPINANGTIGAWTATTVLLHAVLGETAVAYNGFMYVLGGCTNTACTTAITEVDYSPVAANGTLGAWTATTALLNADYASVSVAFNGYIYEIGGFNTAVTNEVDKAAIAANGTIGAWATTSTLPHATYDQSAVVWEGYVYDVGGVSSGVGTSEVDYAAINANGTLGAWASTTALPAANYEGSTFIYNGYLYQADGCTSASCATRTAVVDYAPINANGTVGSWAATTSVPATMHGGFAAVYNGFVYNVGGCNIATCSASGFLTTVSYAPIDNGGPGTLGAWTATTVLPAATNQAASVAYNGYLYEIGGCATLCPTAVVDYAPINVNGTIGSWTATTSLPNVNEGATAVAYKGYLYEIGGNNPITAVIDYAPINTNGTIGSWTATTSYPAATYWATTVVYQGYLYQIGGNDGSAAVVATVDYAPINANGTIGSWTATTSLPAANDNAASVAYNGYLYEIGGDNSSSVGVTTVEYAPINANGTIGSWTATTSLPDATDTLTSVAYDGYLYEIGGCATLCPTAVVAYAPINANGTIGSWTAAISLPAATSVATSVVYNGYVYEIGGNNPSATAVVDYAPLNVIPRTAHYSKLFNEGASGGLTSWNATTSLPAANENATAVAYNGYVYEIGGAVTAVVDYAHIGEDGTIGSWTATTSLPAATYNATSVAYNGYLYEIGGCATSCPTAVVDYAPINANGTIGSWTATTSLPAANQQATSVAYNGYLYEIGGNTGSVTAVVDYVAINANGTLATPWTATISLPAATENATSVANNGYVYEIGGFSGGATAVVDYAPLNGNGTIGAWTATTSLPAATQIATSVAYNGYLYEIGGSTGSTADYAPFNANGTVGSWTGTTSLLAATNLSSSVVYNGYIYEIGGDTGAATAEVDYAPIQYPIPIGTLVSIQYQGTLPGGLSSISFETAGSNGLLTASATAPTVAQGNCISGSIQYIWIRVTLDDSQAGGVFADSIGANNANLTSFTINYMSHPPANQRLHGGKFFSNNVLSPLDTCHP